jgi:trimeric autotransporter adhesin
MRRSSSKAGIIDHGAEGSNSTSVTSSETPTVSQQVQKRSRPTSSSDASAITVTGATTATTAAAADTASTAATLAAGTGALKPDRAVARGSSSSEGQVRTGMSAASTANIEMLDRVGAAASDSTTVSSAVVKKSMRCSSAPSTSATATPATTAAATADAESVAMKSHTSTMVVRRISSDASSTGSGTVSSGLRSGGIKTELKVQSIGQYSSSSRQYTSSNAGDDTAAVAATARSGSRGIARRLTPSDKPLYTKDIRPREDSNGTTTTDTNSSGSGPFASGGNSHAYGEGYSRCSEQRRNGIAARRSGSVNGSVSGSVADTDNSYNTRHNGTAATGSISSQSVGSNRATAGTAAAADTSGSIVDRLGPKSKRIARVSSANSKSEKIRSKTGNAALTADATPAPAVTTTGASGAATVSGHTNSVQSYRGNSSSAMANRGTATVATAAAVAGSGRGSEAVRGVRGRGAAHSQFHVKGSQQAVDTDDNKLYYASLPDQSAAAPVHTQASAAKSEQPRDVHKSGDTEAVRKDHKYAKAMSGAVVSGEYGKGFDKHYNHEVEVCSAHLSTSKH